MGFNISTGAGKGILGKLVPTAFGLFFAFIGSQFVLQEWKGLQESKAMQEWAQTTCTIVSSNVEDQGEDFRLAVSYRYTVDGKTFTSEQYGKQDCYTAKTIGEIKQAQTRLAEGNQVDCHYDPQDPSQAVLELPTAKEAYSSIGFALLFPAFGLFFATVPWLGRRKKETGGSDQRKRSPQIFLILFGLVFTSAGLSMLKPITINPLRETNDAKHWTSVPATVVSSKVKSHSGDDGTTYSVYIAYRYEIEGKEYFGDRYSLMKFSSSGYDSKADIVRQYPEGREFNIFVNPFLPGESVINRDASLSLLFCLFPFPFIIAGLVVLVAGIRNKKPRLDLSQAGERIVELKSQSRTGKAVASILFAAIWNGIVYILFRSAEVPTWFAAIFGLAGIALIGASVHATLALFNPQPTVEITPGDIRPGTSVAMRWRLSGRTDRISSLSIKLQCLKLTKETRGSGKNRRSQIVKTPLHEHELLQTKNHAEIAQGTLQFKIPEDQPSSRPGNENGIRWQLLFHGDITRWPDMKEELPFTIYPND